MLVLATKTHQAQAVLAEWCDVEVGGGSAGERLPIVIALNGVASETMASRYFARVYGACVWMWAAHLTPGEVVLEGLPASGMFHIGRVPAAIADDQDRQFLEGLRDDWTGARLTTRLPADVMDVEVPEAAEQCRQRRPGPARPAARRGRHRAGRPGRGSGGAG